MSIPLKVTGSTNRPIKSPPCCCCPSILDTRCYIQDGFFVIRLRVFPRQFCKEHWSSRQCLFHRKSANKKHQMPKICSLPGLDAVERPYILCPLCVYLFFQQFLILRVATDIFAHKPAQRPDSQPILSGIIQASLNQLAA